MLGRVLCINHAQVTADPKIRRGLGGNLGASNRYAIRPTSKGGETPPLPYVQMGEATPRPYCRIGITIYWYFSFGISSAGTITHGLAASIIFILTFSVGIAFRPSSKYR